MIAIVIVPGSFGNNGLKRSFAGQDHTYRPNAGADGGCMDDIHQMPTDTAFWVSRVNKNTSDYVTVFTDGLKVGSAKPEVIDEPYRSLALAQR